MPTGSETEGVEIDGLGDILPHVSYEESRRIIYNRVQNGMSAAIGAVLRRGASSRGFASKGRRRLLRRLEELRTLHSTCVVMG